VLFFTVWKPAVLTLTAYDFNTLLSTKEEEDFRQITFFADRKGESSPENPWTDRSLKAATPTSGLAPAGYLQFEVKGAVDSDHKWLRVDTAYTGAYGTKFLGFAYGPAPDAVAALEGHYYFQLRYDVSIDSLGISVYRARFRPEGSTTPWRLTPATTDADSLHVKLQDLIKDEVRIITIGTKPVSTYGQLKIGGCDPTGTDFDSVDETDLYTITDGKGRYLVVPIYTDTLLNPDGAPKWVTITDQTVDPNKIPAYQWAVVKIRTTPTEVKKISPLKIRNREFPDIVYNNIQLKTSGTHPQLVGVPVTKNSFVKVPTVNKNDEYLGYKYLKEDDARFNTYVFKYLHSLTGGTDHFLNIKKLTAGAADTSLYVEAETKTQFQLIPYYRGVQTYGYVSGQDGDEKIASLKTLKKQAYTIKVKDLNRVNNTGKLITYNKEDRYVVSGTVGEADTAVFLLKTNNTVAGNDYYALLDTASHNVSVNAQKPTTVKVGVDDATLWAYVQVQKQTRTSTFFVDEWSEPVYRRFDGRKYGYSQIQEPINSETPGVNTPVWLKFTKQNNLGNELLFENANKDNDYRQGLDNTDIRFLGLYNKNQYPETAYTFFVDTAYVARGGSGAEFTPKPQYMLALDPVFMEGDTLYYKGEGVWTRPDGTVYDRDPEKYDTIYTAKFIRARYLFNAQDSIGPDILNDGRSPRNRDYVGKFAYGAEYTTRLAFVDGIHMADTFYVLRKHLGTLPTEAITEEDLWTKIPAADKIYLGDNNHYTVRWPQVGDPQGNFKNDATRNGKSMVFQFRLVDPETDKTRSFLIESQTTGEQIAPQEGRWVKIQNGVPVVSDPINWAQAAQNGAEIFNVILGEEGTATGVAKAPVVSDVQVVSEAGAVTIQNAAGKKVVISNILGQTVANAVLASDNARITLPKGIVVVAVEGAPAVKAIVK
jgi:hypothetical protein